jgi:lanthionine synthetase-like protein
VRAAIESVVADTERAFSPETLWPNHALDQDEKYPHGRMTCLYLGAAGVLWALRALESAGAAELRRDWRDPAAILPQQYRDKPDYGEGITPGLWFGEAGVLLVAHGLAPTAELEEALLSLVRENAHHSSLELAWGSVGTMLAAQVMLERTGDPAWADAWRESADWLWRQWDGELWEQDMPRRPSHVLGPAHGFVGNVLVLARGDLLDDDGRAELERRTVAAIAHHAERAGGCAQWPPALEPPSRPQPIRTQWCHGAPGIVASLGSFAPGNDQLTELLLEGGELTWRAGPLVKGGGLCHGTAGNGYAFLKLFERTGDELWLQRARAFAMHSIEQVERAERDRFTLMTGAPGTALYLRGCLDADASFPILDVW